jgi:hypothetical protein
LELFYFQIVYIDRENKIGVRNMKKRVKTIIIMVSLVVVTGVFTYVSTNFKTNSAQKVMKQDEKQPVINTTPMIDNNLNAPEENKDVSIEMEEKTEPVTFEEEQSTDMIVINGNKYVSVMDRGEFSHRIEVALKYGAKLYAIPNSDGFAIVKDGVPIVHMSTGVASAKPSNTDILCDLFSDQGEYATGIAEGIKHVVQTGEIGTVGVTPGTTGFAIFKRDEWIIVSW